MIQEELEKRKIDKKQRKHITKTPQKLRPRTARANKIIELKQSNPAITVREIAKLTNCDHSNVVRVLQRYGIVAQQVNEFKNHRAEVLAGLQHRILQSITSADIKKTPVGSRILAVSQLFDKERLERGQSTANVAYDAHTISASVSELRAMIADAECAQGDTDG